MTLADQAASALGNISPGDALAYLIGGIAILCLIGTIIAKLIDGVRWWRNRPRLRDLMDDGDGQGGIPPIARKLAQAEAETQAMSMRDFAVNPQLEDICPGFCDNLASVGDPQQCTCIGPCGRRWCTRLREHNPVPVEWERQREGGWR